MLQNWVLLITWSDNNAEQDLIRYKGGVCTPRNVEYWAARTKEQMANELKDLMKNYPVEYAMYYPEEDIF